MYTEILTDNNLTQEGWDDALFEEYVGQMWWKNLIGTKKTSPIITRTELSKNPGDAITIGMRGQQEGGKVTGNAKGIGNEGRVDFFSQRLTIDNVRFLTKVEDVPMTQKRVGFNVLTQVKEALVEKSQLGTDEDITAALSATSSRVRGRYLYGATDANWNATHATALQNVDNTADLLTSKIVSIAKRKALVPVNATAKIRPMRVRNGKNYEEWFIFVGHTYAIRDLVDHDAAWRNQQLMLTPRTNSDSPLFSGSALKGSHNGVLIYEYDQLELISSTIQCAHNLLLGAGAAAIAWGQRSKYGEEYSDVGHDYTGEQHEIRGIEKLVFNRSTPEDNGIVHVFTAGVAD